jgi:hypothetical protein
LFTLWLSCVMLFSYSSITLFNKCTDNSKTIFIIKLAMSQVSLNEVFNLVD